MQEKLKISLPIIVEGKYDKIKLNSILDADIFTTDGFSLFKRNDKLAFFRRISERGVIVLTDSDGAGTLIRSHICSAVPKDRIFQLYTPKVKGKESRKERASAEGILGVEGIDADILRGMFRPFADGKSPETDDPITKGDLYEAGMSGGEGSSEKRARFSAYCSLPERLSPNAMLSALNVIMTREQFYKKVSEFDNENTSR